MRLLTVPETLARKNVTTWAPEWLRRVRGLPSDGVNGLSGRKGLDSLYNEGTLLLYRLGRPDLSRVACKAAFRLRPKTYAGTTFAIQQCVNLARLDAAEGHFRRSSRRIEILRHMLPWCSLPEQEARKAEVIYFVERLALILRNGAVSDLHGLKEHLPSTLAELLAPSFVEVEVRCLVRERRLIDAKTRLSTAVSSDLCSAVAFLVLRALCGALSDGDIQVLLRAVPRLADEVPVHAVQLGEFLFRHCCDRDRLELQHLMGLLYTTSVRVGDAPGQRYFGSGANSHDAADRDALNRGSLMHSYGYLVEAELDGVLARLTSITAGALDDEHF